MSSKIEFGKIKALQEPLDENGDETMAVVIPDDDTGSVTRPLTIPFYWRKKFGNIQVGEQVVYSLASNNSGCIIARVDGEWDSIIRNENTLVQINGNTATKGNVLVEGNSDIIGNLNADGDVCINTTIEAKGGNLTIDGTQIKMNGTTSTGAKAFNGFPSGLDTFTSAPVSQDTVKGNGSLAGGNAENNKDSYYSDSEEGGGDSGGGSSGGDSGSGGGSSGGSGGSSGGSGGSSSGGDSGGSSGGSSGGGSTGGDSGSGGSSSGGSSGGGMTEAEKAEINGKIDALQGQVDALSGTVGTQGSTLETVASNVVSAVAAIESLNGLVEALSGTVDGQKTSIETVSTNVDSLQSDVSSLQSGLESVQKDISALQGETYEYLTNEEIDTVFEE